MTDEMKKQIETAKKIVANGFDSYCGGDTCDQTCPSSIDATENTRLCSFNEFYNGLSDSAEHLKAFRDFIKENDGAVSPKSNKNRRVIVTLDGIEYEQGLIDGTAIDSHLAELDEMISRRDAYNVKMRAVRKLLGRHATMKGRGEFK